MMPVALGRGQGRADVDHGLGQREVAGLGRPVDHRDLVVVLELAVAIRLEDAADAAHAERMQLGGAQRAHAGAAEHVDALGHRPQDLLVPDREHALEVAVDDADRARPLLRHAIDVALGDRRQDDDVAIRRQILRAQRRADEHAGPHRASPTQLEGARTGDVPVVVVRALEPGDHHADDRHAELRSGQVDRHDFADADGAQALQHPGEILGAGARVVGRHVRESPAAPRPRSSAPARGAASARCAGGVNSSGRRSSREPVM